jgi:transglutaminase-like putative cysteine protease
MKKLAATLIVIIPHLLIAQQFNAAAIPDSLTREADAVTRFEEIVFEIKSPGKAVFHERQVYTILNEDGEYLEKFVSPYNKFISIESISGVLYDASGKELKRVKKKDMEDVSGTDEETLMTDTRYKVNHFYHKVYPYTVDYEAEDEINGLLRIPDWVPQGINKTSVQRTRYVLIAPKDYTLRYKSINGSPEPVITEASGKKVYTWEMQNLPAKKEEPLSPTWEQIVPYVMIAPSDFEAEGYKGNMSTWEGFSRFIFELSKGRDVLPDEVKKKVHDLTDNLQTPKEKISVLYQYLQKNTRYISIQLGIGGLQPFDATYVANKRYGDCKALSNFMVALLKEAGIKANNVPILSGINETYIVKDFSTDQFNHQIACVPLKNDTVWLECTDHELPAGYLSGFTADRWGLLVDENGGTLVHTPKYGLKDNLQVRKISAILNLEGNLAASINTNYKAEQQDRLQGDLEYKSKDELLKELKSGISLPTYDITHFDYTERKDKIPPSIDESLELTANSYAQVSGKRLFINPNILNRSNTKLKTDAERKYDILLHYEYKDVDTIEIKIPPGYLPESTPPDIRLENKFGKYISSIQVLPEKILYYRSREQFSGRFPSKDYSDLVDYFDKIYKSDRSKIVLVKKE